jgi:hypothetical protein
MALKAKFPAHEPNSNLALGFPVGAGAWSVLAEGPSRSVNLGFKAPSPVVAFTDKEPALTAESRRQFY